MFDYHTVHFCCFASAPDERHLLPEATQHEYIFIRSRAGNIVANILVRGIYDCKVVMESSFTARTSHMHFSWVFFPMEETRPTE